MGAAAIFLQSIAPWPCPAKWGKPRRVSVRSPELTTATMDAIGKLLVRAGKNGINVVSFLAGRTLPVGRHSNLVAVKKEATPYQSRKRKSPDAGVTTPVPLPQQSNVRTSLTPRTSTPVVNFSVSGRERSTTQDLCQMVQMAMEEFHGKEQDLQWNIDEIVRVKKKMMAARDKHAAEMAQEKEKHAAEIAKLSNEHAADMARLAIELLLDQEYAVDITQLSHQHTTEIAELSNKHAAELRDVKVQCQSDLISLSNQNLVCQKEKYVMGLKDMRQLALTMYPGVVLRSDLKHMLLSDSKSPTTTTN